MVVVGGGVRWGLILELWVTVKQDAASFCCKLERWHNEAQQRGDPSSSCGVVMRSRGQLEGDTFHTASAECVSMVRGSVLLLYSRCFSVFTAAGVCGRRKNDAGIN